MVNGQSSFWDSTSNLPLTASHMSHTETKLKLQTKGSCSNVRCDQHRVKGGGLCPGLETHLSPQKLEISIIAWHKQPETTRKLRNATQHSGIFLATQPAHFLVREGKPKRIHFLTAVSNQTTTFIVSLDSEKLIEGRI